MDYLLANVDILKSVLLYHVVAGAVPAAAIYPGGLASGTTVNGADVTFTVESVDPLAISVNNAAVLIPDVAASNGIIHVIDAVLLPPGFTLPPDITDPPIPTEPGDGIGFPGMLNRVFTFSTKCSP